LGTEVSVGIVAERDCVSTGPSPQLGETELASLDRNAEIVSDEEAFAFDRSKETASALLDVDKASTDSAGDDNDDGERACAAK
jgi:hypothetical protein